MIYLYRLYPNVSTQRIAVTVKLELELAPFVAAFLSKIIDVDCAG